MEKLVADLAFTVGCYIYHNSTEKGRAPADDQIDMVMDDLGGPPEMHLRVRAQIIKGYQSAANMGLTHQFNAAMLKLSNRPMKNIVG